MLSDAIKELRNTSKPNEKVEILKKYGTNDIFKNLVFMTYDPFTHFNVKITPKDLKGMSEGQDRIGHENVEEMYAILDFCRDSFSPKQNREKLLPFLGRLNTQEREFLVSVINKNWKAGVGQKLILKAFPKLIKQFNVQLANTYDRQKTYLQPRWLWSYKLDGVRCVAMRVGEGKWETLSRQGKEFFTVEHIKKQLEINYKRYGYDFFDGELYKHGLSFEEVQGLVTGFTRGQAPELEYHIFITGRAKNFLAGVNDDFWPVAGDPDSDCPNLKYVHQGYITPVEIEETLEKAFEQGYEGIMLRDPDISYDFKRSSALLKLKESLEDIEEGEVISDCIVTDIVYNEAFPYIEGGVMKVEKLINKIWVQQEDGILCKVGTFDGFDLDWRRYVTENPWDLLGSTVEVKHQGYGKNGRMRFPRLFRERKDL